MALGRVIYVVILLVIHYVTVVSLMAGDDLEAPQSALRFLRITKSHTP